MSTSTDPLVKLTWREADQLAELLADACTQVVVFGHDPRVGVRLRQAITFLLLRKRFGMSVTMTGDHQ
jgi:hypothetical protein